MAFWRAEAELAAGGFFTFDDFAGFDGVGNQIVDDLDLGIQLIQSGLDFRGVVAGVVQGDLQVSDLGEQGLGLSTDLGDGWKGLHHLRLCQWPRRGKCGRAP